MYMYVYLCVTKTRKIYVYLKTKNIHTKNVKNNYDI